MGKAIIVIGLVLLVIGSLISFTESKGGVSWLGRLPGDIHIERPGYSFHFPITTCVLISILLTVLMRIFRL